MDQIATSSTSCGKEESSLSDSVTVKGKVPTMDCRLIRSGYFEQR